MPYILTLKQFATYHHYANPMFQKMNICSHAQVNTLKWQHRGTDLSINTRLNQNAHHFQWKGHKETKFNCDIT